MKGILEKILCFAVASLVGWCSFIQLSVHARPTLKEVHFLMENQGPYLRDRKAVIDQLARNEKTDDKLIAVIERNTQAIMELKVEIAGKK